MEAFWRIICHAQPDPPAHRVPQEVRRAEIEGFEGRNDIPDMQVQTIRSGVMRFVTCTMPAGIHEDQFVSGSQKRTQPETSTTRSK